MPELSPAEKLFEANRGLAVHLAEKYARRWPRIVLDELVQDCLIALFRSAQLHDPKIGKPFGPYAMKAILWAIWAHCKKYGYAAPELSLDEPLDDETTIADLADEYLAEEEESAGNADLAELSLIADLKELIRTLATLTSRERKILQMRLRGWDIPRIAARLSPAGNVATQAASAVRKLRQAMLDRGYRALRPEDPVTAHGTGRPSLNSLRR